MASMTALDVHLRRHGICWLVAVGLAALAAILVGLPSRAGARTEGRVAGTTTPTPSPTPQRTGDLGFVGIEGRVYDASRGLSAGIEGAVVEYFGSDPGTVLSDENGDFVFSLFLHDTGYVSIAAWAPGFAASELRSYRALDLYFGEQVEFGLEPGSGEMEITPHGVENLPCEADTAVRIASVSTEGEPLTILAVAAGNSYSQGDYGTGFTVDLSGIDLPLTVPAGEHVDIPVHYSAAGQSYPSRLTVRVRSTARNSNGFAVPYRGPIAGCGSQTPTPTATPTPQRTGDLGIVEVSGRVYDASRGPQAGIAGATVRHSGAGVGAVETDGAGDFAFSLSLHDTDAVRIEVSAEGFTPLEERVYGAVELAQGGPLAFGLDPLTGDIAITPVGALDLPCEGDATVTITSVSDLGLPITITAITASNSYSQGHYGTGFTADLSHIALPLTLPAGEAITFPVHYDADGQSFPSRLTVKVETSASAYPIFGFPYRGAAPPAPPHWRGTSGVSAFAVSRIPRVRAQRAYRGGGEKDAIAAAAEQSVGVRHSGRDDRPGRPLDTLATLALGVCGNREEGARFHPTRSDRLQVVSRRQDRRRGAAAITLRLAASAARAACAAGRH